MHWLVQDKVCNLISDWMFEINETLKLIMLCIIRFGQGLFHQCLYVLDGVYSSSASVINGCYGYVTLLLSNKTCTFILL